MKLTLVCELFINERCMLITSSDLSLKILINTYFMSNILGAPSVYLLTDINLRHSKSLAI